MLRQSKRVSGLHRSFPQTSYPPFVYRNNSLGGIDRLNKMYIPLPRFKTKTTQKEIAKVPPTSETVELIPPSKTSSNANQKGEGKAEDALSVMKHPIKVCCMPKYLTFRQ